MKSSQHLDISALPFAVFVRLADVQSTAGHREVQSFLRLLQSGGWAECSQLKGFLEKTFQDFTALWKAYASNTECYEDGWFREKLGALRGSLSPKEWLELKRDLIVLSGKIFRRSRFFLPLRKSQEVQSRLLEWERFLETIEDIPKSKPETVPLPMTTAEVKTMAVMDHESASTPSTSILGLENVRPWKGGRTPVRCIKIIQETDDVKTFYFAAPSSMLFFYKPGQFMTIELLIEGKVVRRSYTISSSPSRPLHPSITVKRVQGGLVSNWLHDHMKIGSEIFIQGPYGKFHYPDSTPHKILLISAGSGITPMMSISRWLYDTGSQVDTVFLHGARTSQDIIFRKELELLDSQMPNFKLAITCSQSESNSSWSGYTGRISRAMLELIAQDLMHRIVLVCGPSPFMDSIRNLLAELQFPMENYHQESFGGAPKSKSAEPQTKSIPVSNPPILTPSPIPQPSPSAPPPVNHVPPPVSQIVKPEPPPAVSNGQNGFQIEFEKSKTKISSTPQESILEIAEKEDISIPSSCRAGACGTCKIILKSGKVKMDCKDALSSQEEEEGYILACVARPQSSVVLEA